LQKGSSTRLKKFLIKIQHLENEFKPGKCNVSADELSRLNHIQLQINNYIINSSIDWQKEQSRDKILNEIEIAMLNNSKIMVSDPDKKNNDLTNLNNYGLLTNPNGQFGTSNCQMKTIK
jgi:hypothetical protein